MQPTRKMLQVKSPFHWQAARKKTTSDSLFSHYGIQHILHKVSNGIQQMTGGMHLVVCISKVVQPVFAIILSVLY